jgi:hypothetical protein
MEVDTMLNSYHSKVSSLLDTLPIPPATLMIDLHAMPGDVLDLLRLNIENLASEMDNPHWRYLTDIIHLKKLPPLTDAEIEALAAARAQQQVQQRALSGRSQQEQRQYIDRYYRDEDDEPSFLDNLANDELRRHIEESMREINAIRNTRHQALADLGKQGTLGRNVIDPRVRVIFVADEGEPETLSSASAYAALLKHEYGILEQDGQLVLDTMVICLNHDNRGTKPKKLLRRLSWPHFDRTGTKGDAWQHLDSLVLCEYFGANAVHIPANAQPHFVELLLFTLLICQPPLVRPPYPDPSQRFLPPPKTREVRSLPPRTYVVGLSAVEYSARLGRLLLNYDLATTMIEMLQDDPAIDQETLARDVEAWLSDWRALVRSVVPDKITADMPVLRACGPSGANANLAEKRFTFRRLHLDIKEAIVRTVEEYLQAVAQSYTLSTEERDALRKASQEKEGTQQVTLTPTLQDALDSIPRLQHMVGSVNDGEQETPLMEVLAKARGVLGDKRIFKGARGCVPVAQLYLKLFSKAIASFRNSCKREAVNLKERREELEKMCRQRIEELKTYLEHFPLLAGFLKLKGVLAAVTLSLLLMLSVIAWLIAFSWMHHVGQLLLPNLVQTLDQTLSGISYYTMMVLFVLLLDIVAIYLFFRRGVLGRKRSGLWIEVFLVATLLVLALMGWITSFSTVALGNDQGSKTLLFLLQQMHLPFISTIALIVAVVLFVIEAFYYLWWFGRMVDEGNRLIEGIRAHRQETLQAVRNSVADAVALDLLKRAKLTDGNGGEGEYYHRIERLSHVLNEIRNRIGEVSELVTRRLTERVNEKIGNGIGARKVPTLHIRKELLDVRRLLVKDKELRDSLTNNQEELKDFAEILLRVMGEETPISIDQEMRFRPYVMQQFNEESYQERRERHEAGLLTSTTVATALRMAIAMPGRDVVTSLEKCCLDLDYRIAEEYSDLRAVLEMMDSWVMADALNHSKGASITSSPVNEEEMLHLVERSLAILGQIQWERNDKELQTMLASKGIIHHLIRENYDPQTVKSLLATHTVVSGRSSRIGQLGELYVLMFPSVEGRQYFQEIRFQPHFLSIPDTERIVLLYISQYVAEPDYIVEDDTTDGQ